MTMSPKERTRLHDVACTAETIILAKRGVPFARLSAKLRRPERLRGFMADDVEILGDIVCPVDVSWDAER